jgi:hypothetical protein
MKFSAERARRKWPCGGLACGQRPMVTAAVVLLTVFAQAAPAAAARKPAGWSQEPWGGIFAERRPKLRGTIHPVAVPLPKPRPADAPAAEAEKPATAKQAPAETEKPAEQAAPAPPPPSACRLALTEEIAIAPSIPDIHGPGGCGGEDLVRLEAVVLPDKRRVPVKPPAILRCPMASAVADWVRSDMAPLAASLGSAISDLDNFDSFECRGRNRVAGAILSEHGRANALDIRALKLANGQSISLTDRSVLRDVRERVLHSMCARFTTVLGPGSDWYHEDHVSGTCGSRCRRSRRCYRPSGRMKRRRARPPPNRIPPKPSLRNRKLRNPMPATPIPPSRTAESPGRQQKSAGSTGAFDLVYVTRR